MFYLIIRWIINAAALILVAYFVPGVEIQSFYAALIAALILGLINAIIRPIIILLTLPINIITLGLFTLIINAFMLWFASTIVKGFEVQNFVAALLAAILLWAVSLITNFLFSSSADAHLRRR